MDLADEEAEMAAEAMQQIDNGSDSNIDYDTLSEDNAAPLGWVQWFLSLESHDFLLEIDDEYFVLRIGGPHQIKSCCRYLGSLIAHAAAIVDHNTERDRHVFTAEKLDLLFNAVFEHFESGLRKIRHQLSAAVGHAGMHYNQTRIAAKNRGFVCFLRATRGRHCLRRCRC